MTDEATESAGPSEWAETVYWGCMAALAVTATVLLIKKHW